MSSPYSNSAMGSEGSGGPGLVGRTPAWSTLGMRLVVALGGNALLRRGEAPTIERQRAHVAEAAARLAAVVPGNEVVVTHGNGPQVGLLALEAAAYHDVPDYPLDVLGAESQGMVGYLVEQELRRRLPAEVPVVTVLTTVEVDADDPAFAAPSKPIGPGYPEPDARRLERERGWAFAEDGSSWRRVVASPAPRRLVEEAPVRWLLERGSVVICAGGGGVPVVADASGRPVGVEAVVDKDHASSLLACDLGADLLVLATDVPAVCSGYGTAEERAVVAAHPEALLASLGAELPAGSMGPKVEAASVFASATGDPAVIGALSDIEALVAGTAGTRISVDVAGVRFG